MSTNSQIRDFTDLRVWQQARRIRQRVFALVKSFPSFEMFQLSSQMRTAALSVSSNLAEGSGRGSRAEKIRFSRISRGSAFELRDQMTAALDEGYVDSSEYQEFDGQLVVLIKMINSYITAVRNQETR